jgi:hypothetical protein
LPLFYLSDSTSFSGAALCLFQESHPNSGAHFKLCSRAFRINSVTGLNVESFFIGQQADSTLLGVFERFSCNCVFLLTLSDTAENIQTKKSCKPLCLQDPKVKETERL